MAFYLLNLQIKWCLKLKACSFLLCYYRRHHGRIFLPRPIWIRRAGRLRAVICECVMKRDTERTRERESCDNGCWVMALLKKKPEVLLVGSQLPEIHTTPVHWCRVVTHCVPQHTRKFKRHRAYIFLTPIRHSQLHSSNQSRFPPAYIIVIIYGDGLGTTGTFYK